MSEKKVSIYYLIDQYDRIGYVGKADYMNKRLTGHKYASNKSKRYIYCWIRSVGFENIKMVLIEECYFSIWQERESYWIAEYKKNGCKLTNHTLGGEGTSGFKPSEETRKKLSEVHIGFIPSEETRNKISIANTGKVRTKETIDKLSESHKGYKHTDEQKIKIGLAGLGRKDTEETTKKRKECRKDYKHSPETIKKMSESRKGFKHTEDTKKNMSKSHKGIKSEKTINIIDNLLYIVKQKDEWTSVELINEISLKSGYSYEECRWSTFHSPKKLPVLFTDNYIIEINKPKKTIIRKIK